MNGSCWRLLPALCLCAFVTGCLPEEPEPKPQKSPAEIRAEKRILFNIRRLRDIGDGAADAMKNLMNSGKAAMPQMIEHLTFQDSNIRRGCFLVIEHVARKMGFAGKFSYDADESPDKRKKWQAAVQKWWDANAGTVPKIPEAKPPEDQPGA
jgi:hypothetical protein